MAGSISELRDTLIVTLDAELDETELAQLRGAMGERLDTGRFTGLVLDVAALDVLDSYSSRMLGGLARLSNARGAPAVIVGIQPDVALAMVQLGVTLDGIDTALDREEGLALLDTKRGKAAARGA